MNLHDIPAQRGPFDWLRNYDPSTGREATLRNVNPWPTAIEGTFLTGDEVHGTVWNRTMTRDEIEAVYRQSLPNPVDTLVNEVIRLRRDFDRGNFRADTIRRLVFVVSPEEYQELQLYVAGDRNQGTVVVDYTTGTLSVMGIRVIPSR